VPFVLGSETLDIFSESPYAAGLFAFAVGTMAGGDKENWPTSWARIATTLFRCCKVGMLPPPGVTAVVNALYDVVP